MQVYPPVETSGAAVVHSLHNIVFRHCDMDAGARVIAYRHMCRVTNVRSLHITYPIGGNLTYFPRTSELRTVRPARPPPTTLRSRRHLSNSQSSIAHAEHSIAQHTLCPCLTSVSSHRHAGAADPQRRACVHA